MTTSIGMSCTHTYIHFIQLWYHCHKWTYLTIPEPFYKTYINTEYGQETYFHNLFFQRIARQD